MGILLERLVLVSGIVCTLMMAYKNYESAVRDKFERPRPEPKKEPEQKKKDEGWII